MAELPAQSRISSRIEGDELVVIIPKSGGTPRGCAGGSWGLAAMFGFLAVTFVAQGFFSKNLEWTAAGMACFLVAGCQLAVLRGLPGKAGEIQIRIGNEHLTRVSRTGEMKQSRDCSRSAVAAIRVGGNSGLLLHLKDGKGQESLVSGLEAQELEWIAEQIRHKWKV